MLKDNLKKALKSASKEKPLDRYEYAAAIGMHERSIRNAVHNLRNEGVRICSDSAESGYWIAKNKKDYREFCKREYDSRINDMIKTRRAMNRGESGNEQLTILSPLWPLFKRRVKRE